MNGFDWTPVLVAVITAGFAIAGVFIRYAWVHYVGPWLANKGLSEAAKGVVYAVEALLGPKCGEQKWAEALNKMAELGYNVDVQEVIDALKAAWKQLDLQQMIAGEKVPPSTEEPESEEME